MVTDEEIFAQRLRQLIKTLEFNTMSAFADSIGVQSSVIQKYLGKNGHYAKPNALTLQKIKTKFPQVNIDWLVSGLEEPLKTNPNGTALALQLQAAEKRIADLEKQLADKQLIIDLLRRGDPQPVPLASPPTPQAP